MRIGIDQLYISQLRPPGSKISSPDLQLIDQARLYGLDTLPTIRARKHKTRGYELLSGLLTWRVAQALRINEVEIDSIQVDDAAARHMIRVDLGHNGKLDPITQAEQLRDQIEVEGLSRNEVCRHYGLSKSQLSHSLRLLQLEPTVREWVRTGRLAAGKAKVLVCLSPGDQHRIAKRAITNNFSTRKVEGEVRNANSKTHPSLPSAAEPEKDSNTQQLETEVSESLGNPVTIEWNPNKSTGEIVIRYFSLEELQAILGRLQNS